MAHKTEVDQNATRIVEWLLDNRSEFEQNGIEESKIPLAVGLSEAEVTRAIDQLENHEDIARIPEKLSSPPTFLLKPARGWPDLVSAASDRNKGANA
jgi:hypothetical protein